MPFLCKHPWLSGSITGTVSPTTGDSRNDLKSTRSDSEQREPNGREKCEVIMLPFPELKVYPLALKRSHMLHQPLAEASEMSDRSERVDVAFQKAILLANVTE